MKIGVLSFQGDFQKHIDVYDRLGHETVSVRTAESIEALDGLVLPGGESTTIGMLMERFGLVEAIHHEIGRGLAIMGTCAGAILMSREILGSTQPRLSILDTTIERNAYGRQVNSFEADISIPVLGPQPLRGVFIRAPRYAAVGSGVKVLATFEHAPVIVQDGRHIALTFHPELTGDTRLHEYFVESIAHSEADAVS